MLEEIIEQFLINSLQPGSKKVNENVHKNTISIAFHRKYKNVSSGNKLNQPTVILFAVHIAKHLNLQVSNSHDAVAMNYRA